MISCPVVPFGKIENFDTADNYVFVRWAPGDGWTYNLFVSRAGHAAGGYLGGDSCVSIQIGNKFRTCFLSVEDIGLFHESLMMEHFFENENVRDYDVLYYTILINACFGSGEYVEEIVNSGRLPKLR